MLLLQARHLKLGRKTITVITMHLIEYQVQARVSTLETGEIVNCTYVETTVVVYSASFYKLFLQQLHWIGIFPIQFVNHGTLF